jgi:cystathionine beta-lyase/cystathionine gamma-synthase
VVADNTFATPVNQNPLSLGTDLVIHSATKFLGGHADAMGGAACGDAKLVEPIYYFREITGAMLDPMAAHLLIRGMKILPLRIRRQNESSLCIARWLQAQPAVEAVFYPGLESDANHDIAVDCWAGYNLASAQRIAQALEPYNILYLEDPMLSSNVEAYAQLARETSVPICVSETLATRYEFRPFLEQKACDVIMYDATWCGGVSEAKKISDMADTYLIPTSPHTCGGPLLYICSIHLCTAIANFLIMESNYWKYTHQFPYFVNNVPVPEQGQVKAPELPGIGAEIKPELFKNGDAVVATVAKL